MSDNDFPHSYSHLLSTLTTRLREPDLNRVQIVSGPRQVGKTTLLLELARAQGERAHYVSADTPEAALPGWWEAQWRMAEARAASGPAVLLVDEIPYLPDWSGRLKSSWDATRRAGSPLRVVVSGSSALHLGRGARESMAGRFESLRLLHWAPRDLASAFGWTREQAVNRYVRFGGYPGGARWTNEPGRWLDYIRQAIVEPAIGRDLLAVEPVRKPALLRQIFAVAAGHPSEIVSLQKIKGELSDAGALETVRDYLERLEQAALVAPLAKFAAAEIRRRAAPPKLLPLDAALIAAVQGLAPTEDAVPGTWGRLVENAVGCLAWSAGQSVRYWRAEPEEVDFVLEGDWGAWAIEVKSGPWKTRDLAGLFSFTKAHPRFQPLLLCRPEDLPQARACGIPAQDWREYLWRGPALGSAALP